MPTLPSLGFSRSRSIRTAQATQSMAPATTSTTRKPYWARDEDDDQSQASQPMATPIIRRKPVGMSPQATTVPDTSISTSPLPIPRKPVPTPPVAEQVLAYTPVDGNPYRTDSFQQCTNHVELGRNFPVSHVEVHKVVHQPEFLLSTAPQTASGTKPKATGVLSREFGTIRKAAGHARRSPSTSYEAQISPPITGSFHRSGLDSPVVMETPLHLVGLEVAQADVPRYGKPDHLLESPHTVGPRSDSLNWLTSEPIPTQPSAAPAPAPAAPAAPAALLAPPAGPGPERSAPRKVVNEADCETLFGDIIAAAQDYSWVTDSEAQAKGPAKGEDKDKRNASGTRPPAVLPPSFKMPSSGNPFARPHPSAVPASLGMSSQPTNLDKSLPPSPAPGSIRRQTAVNNPIQPAPHFTSRFAEALESDGGRRASYVPGIKCSDCGKMIDAIQVADHRCGKRAAQAVDRDNWQPAELSRADTYASNYGRPERLAPTTTWGRDCMQSLSGLQGHETGFVDDGVESDVVVDTFVREDHTSWRGVVNSGVDTDVQSMRGHISGGSDGIRRSNRVDEANYWRNKASDLS